MISTMLGDISPQQFLQEYWQQKPLLIRQAFSAMTVPFNAEELAGLACEIDSARLVIQKSRSVWQLKSSPLTEKDFLNLPDSHWTFLINDLEQYYPELRILIAQFNFIPDWRVDDLMLSYAANQGSVGPHTDDYDVFLIQAYGERQWAIDSQADPTHLLEDCDLCILQDFKATKKWLLQPGDMLYLPPKLAHHGVAQGECMTYSVGFRAPSQHDLIESYLGELAKKNKLNKRFHDAKRTLQNHSAELKSNDITSLKNLLFEALEQNDDFIARWLGKYLTETRQDNINVSTTAHYKKETNYQRHPSIRFIWRRKKNTIHLYYAGMHTAHSADLLFAIQYLTENYYYHSTTIAVWQENEGFLTLFNKLLNIGIIEEDDT